MNRRKNNRGYSLVEVLFAVAVITIGAFGLLAACYASVRYEWAMLDRAEIHKTADYAYALLRQHCSQNPGFLMEAEAEAEVEGDAVQVFPEGGGLGEYPADRRWRWLVKSTPDEDVPGLHRVTVLVYERRKRNTPPSDGEAVYILRTFFSERQ
jgi:prepilin-type N-terminal cleavage/methylation domain-containing protein